MEANTRLSSQKDEIEPGTKPPAPEESPQSSEKTPDISKSSRTTLVDFSEKGTPGDSNSPTSTYPPVEYAYLGFNSPLPSPIDYSAAKQPSLPGPPDLKRYTSPFEWPNTRKYVITALACTVTVLAAAAAGCYSPPEAELTRAWGISGVVYNIGITVFTLGFGIAPMVLAPFSEINGRRPMFIYSGILFTVCHIGCGVTRSFAGMILARFFLGVGGSTFSTIVGGIISDIYHAKDRNAPMALFATAALFGTGLGPLFSGAIVKHTSWRWVYYSQAIVAGVVTAAVVLFFKETRGNVLLSRKARALNQWYEELENAGCPGLRMETAEGSQKDRFDKIAMKLGKVPTTPEGRLYFVCVESILMPAGLFWFGWTSGPSTHWIWPALAVGCATIGIFSIYLAVFNYMADTYHRYASSALAAQSFCRNVLGGAFPLVTKAMFNNLGYPEASSLLGGIVPKTDNDQGALLTIVPWVLAIFGPRIRARSKFASATGQVISRLLYENAGENAGITRKMLCKSSTVVMSPMRLWVFIGVH
ncbi:conserved hypothetical protein [Uncinocarpus reesii 1704]|uniref:Major facilitator superfamily (MFS) profile domain-containing protein n=1 Tax=Uncinocarpus reesii (strain UAMH 1704) TaxID=336963 RepID=C4JHU8_UNCRE|nr:uncharacterized protein UREG_02784 [Uncinocarpus reesii 1704]EEP77935.1 conserved hypothetical protein [Uncinocarpus reesii 1704]